MAEYLKSFKTSAKATKTVALVGQPNVGKSLVFFRLTANT